MLTGFAIIDLLTPIGRGQRQLIIGDRNAGKTYLAKNICLNQKRNNRYFSPEGYGVDRVFCIYVCIGLKRGEVYKLMKWFVKGGVTWYTSVIAATAGESSIKQYTAAYKGCSMGEVYRDYGYNALVIYDSLTNHAIAHRQTSLLLKVSPGREAYPGDTFYIHAKLLERAAQLSKKLGYGSLTALPIVETQANNITAYIPTNIISITDGQIFLSSDLSKRKVYPAVDVQKSISRVGSHAQPAIMKEITPLLRKKIQD
jgi:F-type H+-transporting ATPase subunit alpha